MGHATATTHDYWLDDEVRRAGALHDLRGALTAVWTHLESVGSPTEVQDSLDRAVDALRVLASPPGASVAPPSLLACALEPLLGSEPTEAVLGRLLSSGEADVPLAQGVGAAQGWSSERARAWERSGAPELHVARVRVAARLCGITLRTREADGFTHLELAWKSASG